jgi:hypothetical protein
VLSPIKKLWVFKLVRITLVSLVFGEIGNSLSQPIYRCGDAYSSSMHCALGNATEVTAHSEPYRQLSAPGKVATYEQHEADALEKKRIESERQATRSPSVRVLTVPVQNQSTPTPPTSSKGHKAHRPPSPYFTAKDPVKPIKNAVKD